MTCTKCEQLVDFANELIEYLEESGCSDEWVEWMREKLKSLVNTTG